MSFEVGDFLMIEDEATAGPDLKGFFRIVVNPAKQFDKTETKEVENIILSKLYFVPKTGELTHAPEEFYIKIQPTRALIETAKIEVEAAYNKKRIDNLTFIEITARLREHEQNT